MQQVSVIADRGGVKVDRTYTTEQLANLLSVSTRTVRRWVDEGAISYVDIGSGKYRKPRFTEAHVQEFIDNNVRQTS